MNDQRAFCPRYAKPSQKVRAALVFLLIVASYLTGCAPPPGQAARITDDARSRSVIVPTQAGAVRGLASRDGTVFLGIPFAAPPVGSLRFAPPAPVKPWSGVRDAEKLAPACPQSLPFGKRSEDCLYLNVYGPPGLSSNDRLPVMVWLYGGALVFGSNAQYDGTHLAASQHVIVVVPNYRLGALGFFAHPALAGKPGEGNYGLLDQRAALAWVHDNIAAFGGDPARVTLFGQSAGAMSACTQMVSPGSRGLFDRVILESDTCIFPDQSVTQASAEAGGIKTAADLGCGKTKDVLACLRALPAKDFVGVDSHHWGNGGKNGWSPMIGGDVLPESQRALFAAGRAAPAALLMGSNRTEGRLFANLLSLTLAWRSQSSYEGAVARSIRPQVRPAALKQYADVAQHSRYRAYAEMVTDSHFSCPVLTLHALRGDAAQDYVYEFDDPNAPTIIPQVPFTPRQASYHSAELIYIFDQNLLFAHPDDWQPDQKALSLKMQDYWGAFARSGRPEPAGQPAWPVFDGEAPLHLTPTGSAMAADFAQRHRCAFWSRLGY